jgi:hypothetical protein
MLWENAGINKPQSTTRIVRVLTFRFFRLIEKFLLARNVRCMIGGAPTVYQPLNLELNHIYANDEAENFMAERTTNHNVLKTFGYVAFLTITFTCLC